MLKKLATVVICGLVVGCQSQQMEEMGENPFPIETLSYTELRDDFLFIYDENNGDLTIIIPIMEDLTKAQKIYLMKEAYRIEQDENKRREIKEYLERL